MAKQQRKKRRNVIQRWWKRPLEQEDYNFLLKKLNRDELFTLSDDDRWEFKQLIYFYRRHSRENDVKALILAALTGAGITMLLLHLTGRL